MNRRSVRRGALVVAAVLALTACSAADLVRDAADAPAEDLAGGEPLAAPEPEVDAPAQVDAEDASEPAADPFPPGARPVGRTPEHVIKEGTVTLEIEEDGFMDAYGRVVEVARRLGGSVTASTSTTDDDGRTTGSVTVRVPVETYEDLLVDVARIGTLVGQNIRSEEVTGQVVDLRSRLRHLRAQEAFYLGLLDDAADVQDAIAVQRQVDDIQQRIEQLQGRLDHLEDRADYSTLSVELVEAGAAPLTAAAPGDEPSLAVYWQHARNGFVTLVGWTLVAVVTLAPVLVPLALAALVWRVVRRRPTAPATVATEVE